MNEQIQDRSFSSYFIPTFLLVAISGFFLTYLLLAGPSDLWYVFIPVIISSVIFFSIISIVLTYSIKSAKNTDRLAITSLIISSLIAILPILFFHDDPGYALLLFLCGFIFTFFYTLIIQFIVFKVLKK